MKSTPTILTLLACAAPLAAQETALAAGRVHADSLPTDATHTYVLDLEAGSFVLGEADQQTVDVVVTIYDPAGQRLRRFDGPARGPEMFQFDADSAGRYRIEVEPFQDETGRYAIVLRRVEPIAETPAQRVDQIMAPYTGAVPGGVVAVIRGGEIAFAKGYGLSNLRHDLPFTTATRTNIGSTSKQFTAFAIGLLATRGKLSLDDDVRTHIPELQDFGKTITLRHFLTHTSGYREFLNTLALGGRRLGEGDHIERSELIDVVARQPELQNQPGAEFNYNNTGFGLLATVVERVGGKPFPEWMAENVFGPLGMAHTMVRAHPLEIVPNGSQGYAPDKDGWREAPDLGGAMGAGAIYTTVADLAQWLGNFGSGKVGGPDLVRALRTRNVLTNADTSEYGLGLFVDRYRGLERVHHGGADVAHRSMLRYFPALDAGVVALSNNANFNSAMVADAVVDAFFAAHLEPAGADVAADAAPFDPAAYDPEDFDALAGRYALDEMPSFNLTFSRDGDEFFAQGTGQPKVGIVPTSDSTFRITVVDASITFHRAGDGEVDRLTLHQNGDHPAQRVGDAWEPTPDELAAYAGRYFSAELETFYTVVVEDDRLVLRHRRLDDIELSAGDKRDDFSGGFPVAEVVFERNEAGAVTGLTVSNGRTRGVWFRKEGG